MSSRKSEPEASSSAAALDAVQPGDGAEPARPTPALRANGWLATLWANAPLPILILLLFPLASIVEDRDFGSYNRRIVMLVGFNIILAVSLQLINGVSGQFSLGHAGFMAIGAYLAAFPAKEISQKMGDPAAVLVFYLALGVVVVVSGAVLWAIFQAVRATKRIHPTIPSILTVVLIGWILWDFAKSGKGTESSLLIWSNGLSWTSASFSWLLAKGLPVAANVSAIVPEGLREPLCFIVLVIGGGACAAGVGFIVGLPALRLRGDYLAIATLGFAEIIRIAINNADSLGGPLGLLAIPRVTDFVWLYAGVIITIVVVWRITYSAKGLAVMAVREDEIAAAASGIGTTQHKVFAFIVGAFFGGVAGVLFAMHEYSITPSYFGLQKSIEIVVIVTLGGLGSISGAILAAIVLTVLLELLREPPSLFPAGWIAVAIIVGVIFYVMKRRGCVSAAVVVGLAGAWELGVFLADQFEVKLDEFRMIIYSLSLVLMMLLRPQGLLGGRELWPRRWGARHEVPPTLEPRTSAE